MNLTGGEERAERGEDGGMLGAGHSPQKSPESGGGGVESQGVAWERDWGLAAQEEGREEWPSRFRVSILYAGLLVGLERACGAVAVHP